MVDVDAIKVHVQDQYLSQGSSKMVSSVSRMSFRLAEIPKIFKFLNANLMADVRLIHDKYLS